MIKVLVWGLGPRCDKALDALNSRRCVVLGFVDNNPEKAGGQYKNKNIYSFEKIPVDFDYLVVTVFSYQSILYQLEQARFSMDKVVVFYDISYIEHKKYWSFIDWKAWKIAVLEEKIQKLEQYVESGFANIG